MSAYSSAPMLKAAGLWAKTSAKGGQYFAGRLGGVKVLILENRDRKSDADPSHNLFFVESAPRQPAGASDRHQGNAPRPASNWQAPIRPRTEEPPRLPFDADADADADTPEWAR